MYVYVKIYVNFCDLMCDKCYLRIMMLLMNFSKKSVQDILASGRLCFLDVEINGVKSIKAANMSPTPRFIFIQPPSIEDLVCTVCL
jgi:guanylate kinase